jgi:hypothetical protein
VHGVTPQKTIIFVVTTVRKSNLKSNRCFERIKNLQRPTSFSKYCTPVSDGKVVCLKMECPAVETVCDREMTAVAVPGTEGECCQKYICGMYLNPVMHKYMMYLHPQVCFLSV